MKARKKICFVLTQPGSARSFFKPHIQKWTKYFDVHLVTNNTDNSDLSDIGITKVKSIPLRKDVSIAIDIKNVYLVYKYLKQEKFDVVISMTTKASLTAALASFLAKVPHRIRVFTGQIWCNKTGIKRWGLKLLDKITVALDTEFLTDSRSQMEYLEEQKVVRREQYTVLANGSICGVDPELCRIDQEIRNRIRKELGIENKVVYEFLGRLKREKGVYELLEAFDRMVPSCPNAVLLLVGGDQENYASTIDTYKNLKKGENVIYYGFTSEPLNLTMVCDVFCLPSYREGFPNSPLEASCMGIPLICSDIYGMRDTMEDNVTGLRCRVMDSESLYECMLKLYNDKNMREAMGVHGRERMLRLFPRDLVTDAWLQYFKDLLNVKD